MTTSSKHKCWRAYSAQARHIKRSRLKKYAALLASPLAALPFSGFAQCVEVNITSSNSKTVVLDMDGGVNDFSIQAVDPYGIQLNNLNPGSFSVAVATNTGFAARLLGGETLSTQNYNNNGTLILRQSSSGAGPWTAGGGFIGIRKGSQYGFIELSYVSTSFTTISSDDSQTGLETATNGMTVQAGICNSLLPVELLAFTAKMVENQATLAWKTATETNNAGFEIQHSTDGKVFEKIGWLDGKGTTVETQEYTFVDEKAAPGQNYYRLKQMDTDGVYAFSEIISLALKSEKIVVTADFFPNPAQHTAQITLTAEEEGDVTITLYDSFGKTTQTSTQKLTTGTNQLFLHVADLPKGSYFAKIQAGEQVLYRKLIVAK